MARRATRLASFSAEWINSVSASEGRVEWHDEGCRGLVIRISPAGSQVFYWVGRVAGQQSREKIGPFPAWSVGAARTEAKRLSGVAASGQVPKSTSKLSRDEWTLQQLHDWYMEAHSKPHKRTWKTDERRFKSRLSHWANRKLSRITKAEVAELHTSIGAKHGPYAANKMLELLGHQYRLGRKILDIKADDPTRGVTRFGTTERERFLTPDEVPRFLAAVDNLPRETSADFLRLALFTGARRHNVETMRWDEIDLDASVWTIPADKSKNKKPMRIALCKPAIDILKRRKKKSKSEFVLPGKGPGGHISCPKYAFAAACGEAGIKGARIHDLRRTLGSWMAASGTSLALIGKCLGHTSLKATQIYARLNLDPVRVAVAAATSAMLKTPAKKRKPR